MKNLTHCSNYVLAYKAIFVNFHSKKTNFQSILINKNNKHTSYAFFDKTAYTNIEDQKKEHIFTIYKFASNFVLDNLSMQPSLAWITPQT